MTATVTTPADLAATVTTLTAADAKEAQARAKADSDLADRVTKLETAVPPVTPPVPPIDPPPVTPPSTDPRLPSSTAINVPDGMWMPAVRDAKNGDQLAMPAGVSVLTGDVTTAISAKSLEVVPQASALLPQNADGTYPAGSLAILEAQGSEFYWYATGSGSGQLLLRDVSLRANTTGSPSGSEHGSALIAPMDGMGELRLRRVAFTGDKDMKSGQQIVYAAPHPVGSSSGGVIGLVELEDCDMDGMATQGFGLQTYGPGTISRVYVHGGTVRNFPVRAGLMAWTTIQSYEVAGVTFAAVCYIFRNETSVATSIHDCKGTYQQSDGPFTGTNAKKIVAANNSFARAA